MLTNLDPLILPEREETSPLQEQFAGLAGSGEELPAAAILSARPAEAEAAIPAPVFIP